MYVKFSSFLDISKSPEKHVNNLKTCPKNRRITFMGKNHLSLILNLTKISILSGSVKTNWCVMVTSLGETICAFCPPPSLLTLLVQNPFLFYKLPPALLGSSVLPSQEGTHDLSFSEYSKCPDTLISVGMDNCLNKFNKNHFQDWNKCWGLKEDFFSFQDHCC